MPAPSPLRTVTSHAELMELTGADPYIRYAVPDPPTGAVVALDGVVAVERSGRHRRSMAVIPTPPGRQPGDLAAAGTEPAAAGTEPAAAVAEMLLALRPVLAELGIGSLSVPQRYAGTLARHYRLGPGGDWDWMWTTTVPAPLPGEDRIVVLDDAADAEEIREFTRAHNPRVWTEVGTGRVQDWVGLRDRDGALLAIGGAEREATGIPHLAGIVTHLERRGQGLGTLVSAALTRMALREHPACTLGMFSDNAPARAVYHRLGYRTAHAWCSRPVQLDDSS